MAKGTTYVVRYRRRRGGKTDYRKRLDLLKSGKHCLVIRPSNKHISLQVVDYKEDGDSIIASSHSSELKKFGWKHNFGNLPAAYLTGFLGGSRCKEKKIKECILDIGLRPSVRGSRIYSALKGVIDAGIKVPVSEEVFPPEERIKGRHISEYKKIKDMGKEFEVIKKKIKDEA